MRRCIPVVRLDQIFCGDKEFFRFLREGKSSLMAWLMHLPACKPGTGSSVSVAFVIHSPTIHSPTESRSGRMIFEAALLLILILLITIPIVKAYEWLQDFLYGPYINRGE